jgi:hypothetical protein
MGGAWLPRSLQFHLFAMIGLNLASLVAAPCGFLGQNRLSTSTDEQE